MFRSTISVIRKAFLCTFVPQNWRGHLKQVAKFEKLPGLLSTVQKTSNSGPRKVKERCEKYIRLKNNSLSDSKYSHADTRGYKIPLHVHKEQIALILSHVNTKFVQLKDTNIEKINKTTFAKQNKNGQEYLEQYLNYLTTKNKDIDHSQEAEGKQKLEKLDEPTIVIEVKSDLPTVEPHNILSDRAADYKYFEQCSAPYLNNISVPLADIDYFNFVDATIPYFLKNGKINSFYPRSNIKDDNTLFNYKIVERGGKISPTAMIDNELCEDVGSKTLHQWRTAQPTQDMQYKYNTREKQKYPAENSNSDINALPQQFLKFKRNIIYPDLFNYSLISGNENDATGHRLDKENYSKNETVASEPKILDLDMKLENPFWNMVPINEMSSINYEVVKSYLMSEKPSNYEATAEHPIENEVTLRQEYQVFIFKSMLPLILHHLQRKSFKNYNGAISKSKTVEPTFPKFNDYPVIVEQEEGPEIFNETLIYPFYRNNTKLVHQERCINADIDNLSTSQNSFSKERESLASVKWIIHTMQNFQTMAHVDNKIQPKGHVNASSELGVMIELSEQTEAAPVEEIVVNIIEGQESLRTQSDQSSVLKSYSLPDSVVLTYISAIVGPIPVISNSDIQTMRLSQILKKIKFHNRRAAFKEFPVGLASMSEEKAMKKCPKPPPCLPPPPVRPNPCAPKKTKCPCIPNKEDPCKKAKNDPCKSKKTCFVGC